MKYLLILLLLCVTAPAFADPGALDQIRAAGVIRFGVTGDYPPFAQKMPDGGLVGADVEAGRKFAKSLGVRPEFVFTTWQTLISDFSADKFDVTLGGLTVLPERAAIGTYSVVLMDDGKRPIARCADKDRYKTIDDIDKPGVRVMINRGPTINTLAKQWFAHADLTIHTEDGPLTEQLLHNEADVWVTDGVVIDQMVRRYPGKLCATTLEPFTHLTKGWLIRNDPPLIDAVNKFLSASLASGEWKTAMEAMP